MNYGPTLLAVPLSSNPDVTTDSGGLIWTNVNMLPSGAMNSSNSSKEVPVQSALTVYVPDTCCLRITCPLKLAEKTLFTWPLPSKTSYPAPANGTWSFPVMSTPFQPSRYVPCSVALEHFSPAAFSSSANPVPTASTPTRPTTPNTPNTTNRAATYLFMRSLYLLALSGPTAVSRSLPLLLGPSPT